MVRLRLFARRNRAFLLPAVLLALVAAAAMCAGQRVLALVLFVPPYVLWGIVTAREDGRTRAMTWELKKLLDRKGLAAVGDLAIVLGTSRNADACHAARESLLKLLPRLDPPTYRSLDPCERDAVRTLCADTDDASLALSLVAAIERVTDTDALPVVRRLAEGRCWTARDPRVIEAAKCCAGYLEEATRQQHDAATLLRPADPDAAGALLRPAGGAPETPAEQLLRPSSHGDAPERANH